MIQRLERQPQRVQTDQWYLVSVAHVALIGPFESRAAALAHRSTTDDVAQRRATAMTGSALYRLLA